MDHQRSATSATCVATSPETGVQPDGCPPPERCSPNGQPRTPREKSLRIFSALRAALALLLFAHLAAADWLHWRGPHQNGSSDETGLPETALPDKALWVVSLAGRGTPVIRGERVYVFGYRGEGGDLQEIVACLDAATGATIWEHRYSDFLSDVIYDRYSIGSATIDPATGSVHVITSAGLLLAFDADGKELWRRSLMEELGRMTFPNGRNGAPVIHRDLVLIHCMTANWGAHGPAQDRFYAFDKRSGAPVWASAPGIRPKDNSFSAPVLATWGGKEVFYSGTGCGNVVCINANTGEPLWRFGLSAGGVNASLILHGADRLLAVHGKENLDSSDSGRLIALRRDLAGAPNKDGSAVLSPAAEVWRNNEIAAYSSSPVLVGDRLYVTTETGDLAAVDALSGNQLWREKLGIEQLHASPAAGDGKLYVPIKDGVFAVVKPGDQGPTILSKAKVAGECIGAPAIANGRVYLHTTEKLYCFGAVRPAQVVVVPAAPALGSGAPAKLIPVPSEVLLRPGASLAVALTAVDGDGLPVALPGGTATWAPFIPPTAKVKALLGADFAQPGAITARAEAKPSAGQFEATLGAAKGYLRGRVLPAPPITEDFESFATTVAHETETGVTFAYPPLPWIGARFKWEVRTVNGAKVLAKTIDNKLFQRAVTFIGDAALSGCTVAADVMSDGNKRKMSEVGVINQRYAIILKGNAQELEVNSNLERLRVAVPFAWTPGTWYRLTTKVEVAADGRGSIRAKVWKRGEPEPAAWTIDVPHANAHRNGAPGLFGFSPAEQRVYLDNISVTP